jgi:hypothetical protein
MKAIRKPGGTTLRQVPCSASSRRRGEPSRAEAVREKEAAGPGISQAWGYLELCGLDNGLVFVCVQTQLWSGLVFVLFVALSDVSVLEKI